MKLTCSKASDVFSGKNESKIPKPGLILSGTSAGGQLAFATASKLLDSNVQLCGIVASVPLTVDPKVVPPTIKAKYTAMEENRDAPILSPEILEILLGQFSYSRDIGRLFKQDLHHVLTNK